MLFGSLAEAKFYEITSIDEMLKFISSDDVVLFDIDYTTLITIKGSTLSHVVEKQTPKIISDLQAKKVRVIAVTRRQDNEAEATFAELKSIGVDFSKTSPQGDASLDLRLIYQNGVIFTSEQPKGPALEKFLAAKNIKPTSIILLDDPKFKLQT